MPVESATFVSGLNSSYPAGSEAKSQGDDHLRLLKAVLLATFPNADKEIDFGKIATVAQITGNVAKVAGDFKFFPATDYITATATITLPTIAGVTVNTRRIFRSITTGEVLLDPDGTDTIDGLNANLRIPAYTEIELVATAAGWLAMRRSQDFVGRMTECGTVTPPQGWLLCDGSAVSRTTYAGLFAVLGTTFNHGGEAGTDFRLPDRRGRVALGSGTGTLVEQVGAADVDTTADTFLVGSNDKKWITGMAVLVTTSGALPTTDPAGGFAGTVYIIRVDSTHIAFASSRANAVAGTKINITAIGSGTHTVTHSLTARTLGEKLGEEDHANTTAETPAHTHSITDPGHSHTIRGQDTAPGGATRHNISATQSTGTVQTNTEHTVTSEMTGITNNNTGSSDAHNTLPPALVCGIMIKL